MAACDWIKALRKRFAGWRRSFRISDTADFPGGDVDGPEEISTFVLHESRLNKATGRIRHEQLMPRSINGRQETSVYRTGGLSQPEVWQLIRDNFEANGRNHAKARGFGPATSVFEAGLSFDADGKPHRRHANIIGWHETDKHLNKQMAIRVAQHFAFEMRPSME